MDHYGSNHIDVWCVRYLKSQQLSIRGRAADNIFKQICKIRMIEDRDKSPMKF